MEKIRNLSVHMTQNAVLYKRNKVKYNKDNEE